MFKAIYTIIHNRGTTTATTQHRSPKRAVEMARREAWSAYEKTDSTNWADCWLNLTSSYGKEVYSDFVS